MIPAISGALSEYAAGRALALPEQFRTPEVLSAIAKAWEDGRAGIRVFKDGTLDRRNCDIDDLLWSLREECKSLGLAYDSHDERSFSRHIMTAKGFGAQARQALGRPEPDTPAQDASDRITYAVSIIRAAYKACRAWDPVAGPRQIYRKHAAVYNEYMLSKKKASDSMVHIIQ